MVIAKASISVCEASKTYLAVIPRNVLVEFRALQGVGYWLTLIRLKNGVQAKAGILCYVSMTGHLK